MPTEPSINRRRGNAVGRPRRGNGSELITAIEIACFVYCPEQWRLQYGLGLKPGNRAALDAGNRHHWWKAIAERIAGAAISLGQFLAVLAAVVLLLLLWWWIIGVRPVNNVPDG